MPCRNVEVLRAFGFPSRLSCISSNRSGSTPLERIRALTRCRISYPFACVLTLIIFGLSQVGTLGHPRKREHACIGLLPRPTVREMVCWFQILFLPKTLSFAYTFYPPRVSAFAVRENTEWVATESLSPTVEHRRLEDSSSCSIGFSPTCI